MVFLKKSVDIYNWGITEVHVQHKKCQYISSFKDWSKISRTDKWALPNQNHFCSISEKKYLFQLLFLSLCFTPCFTTWSYQRYWYWIQIVECDCDQLCFVLWAFILNFTMWPLLMKGVEVIVSISGNVNWMVSAMVMNVNFSLQILIITYKR